MAISNVTVIGNYIVLESDGTNPSDVAEDFATRYDENGISTSQIIITDLSNKMAIYKK